MPHLAAWAMGGVSAGIAPMIVKLARSVQRVQQRVQQVHSAAGSNVCTVCGLGTTAAPEIEKCTVYPAGKERAAGSAKNVRVRAKIIPTTVEGRAYSASLASSQLQAALSATTALRRRVPLRRRRVPLRRDRFGEDLRDDLNAKVGSLQSQIVTLKQITEAKGSLAQARIGLQRASEGRHAENLALRKTIANQNVLIETTVSQPPFFDEDPMGVYQRITEDKGHFVKCLDSDTKSLVKHLLTVDLSERHRSLKVGESIWASTLTCTAPDDARDGAQGVDDPTEGSGEARDDARDGAAVETFNSFAALTTSVVRSEGLTCPTVIGRGRDQCGSQDPRSEAPSPPALLAQR